MHRVHVMLGVAFLVSAFFFRTSIAEEVVSKEEPTSQIDQWIDQLGSDIQSEREAAVEELLKGSSEVMAQLKEESKTNSDAEIRSRCKAIATSIYKRDVEIRKQNFLRDIEPNGASTFSSWKPFSEIVGTGRLAKKVFEMLIDAHGEIAELDVTDKDRLTKIAENLAHESVLTVMTGEETETADAIALLFLSIQLEGNCSGDVEATTSRLIRTAPYTVDFQTGQIAPPLRKLAGRWLLLTKNDSTTNLITALDQGIPEGRSVAIKLLQQKLRDSDSFEVAIQNMMQFGKPEDIKYILPWLEDERLLHPPYQLQVQWPMNVPGQQKQGQGKQEQDNQPPAVPAKSVAYFEVRYQDFALAACLKILNEDVSKCFPRKLEHPTRGFMPYSLAFPVDNPEERTNAFELWRQIYERNKQPN